jgi:hypothetical protein
MANLIWTNNWGSRSDSKVTGLSTGNDVIRATQGNDRLEGRPAPGPGDRDYDPAKPQPKTVNQRDYDNHRPEHFPKSLDHPAHKTLWMQKINSKIQTKKTKKKKAKRRRRRHRKNSLERSMRQLCANGNQAKKTDQSQISIRSSLSLLDSNQ